MPVQIKICGITTVEDALVAVAAGADYLGFVFAANSSRQVSPDQVGAIRAGVPAAIRTVGVFVNQTVAEIRGILTDCGLDIAQLHGDETPEMAQAIGPERVWRAVHLHNLAQLPDLVAFPAAAVVVDAAVAGQRGGTGTLCDWDLAREAAEQCRVVLAGGLNAGNIASAIRDVRPWAVDVSSGVEVSRGRKDPSKIQQLIAAARAAETSPLTA